MPKFTDNESRSWDIRIDVETVRRVRAKYGIDLGKVFSDQSQLRNLFSDVCMIVDVIYESIADQADARGVTPEQFGRSMAGDAIAGAITAFEESIVDFLPESNRRALVRQIIEAGRAANAQATLRLANAMKSGLLEQGIAAQNAELDERIEAIRNPTPIMKSTVSVIGPLSAD